MGPSASVLKGSPKNFRLRIRDDDLLDEPQRMGNRKNTGNDKYSLEKRYLKHEKNKKEILKIYENNTYSYSVLTKNSSKPKFTKNKVTGSVTYDFVLLSEGMLGVKFIGKGNRYYKDDIGEDEKWNIADSLTVTHDEFIGTKYLEIKFKNVDENDANSEDF